MSSLPDFEATLSAYIDALRELGVPVPTNDWAEIEEITSRLGAFYGEGEIPLDVITWWRWTASLGTYTDYSRAFLPQTFHLSLDEATEAYHLHFEIQNLDGGDFEYRNPTEATQWSPLWRNGKGGLFTVLRHHEPRVSDNGFGECTRKCDDWFIHESSNAAPFRPIHPVESPDEDTYYGKPHDQVPPVTLNDYVGAAHTAAREDRLRWTEHAVIADDSTSRSYPWTVGNAQ